MWPSRVVIDDDFAAVGGLGMESFTAETALWVDSSNADAYRGLAEGLSFYRTGREGGFPEKEYLSETQSVAPAVRDGRVDASLHSGYSEHTSLSLFDLALEGVAI